MSTDSVPGQEYLPPDAAADLLEMTSQNPGSDPERMSRLLFRISQYGRDYRADLSRLAALCVAEKSELGELQGQVAAMKANLADVTRDRDVTARMGYEARRRLDAMLHGINMYLIKFANQPPIDTQKWLTDLRARIDDLPEPHDYAAAVDRFFDRAGWVAGAGDPPPPAAPAGEAEASA